MKCRSFIGAVSIDACGDSFYEYLLKAWIQSGHTDSEAREMYDAAMTAVVNNLIHTSSEGLIYAARKNGGVVQHKMGHLACFAGGLISICLSLDGNILKNFFVRWFICVGRCDEVRRKFKKIHGNRKRHYEHMS